MKRAKNNRSVWLIAMALFPAAVMAQTTSLAHSDSLSATRRYKFSLQQTVDYANKNNVQVKNALLAVQIQEQNNR